MMNSHSADSSPTLTSLNYNNHNRHSSHHGGMSADNNLLLLSDLDREQLSLQEEHNMATQLLDAIGGVLDQVDTTITTLEDDTQLLPSAILRKCTEFADVIGSVASQLESQTPEQRDELARAIQHDVTQLAELQQLQLAELSEFEQQQQYHGGIDSSESMSPSSFHTTPLFSPKSANEVAEGTGNFGSVGDNDPPSHIAQQQQQQPQSLVTSPAPTPVEVPEHTEIVNALVGVSTLLRDVESSFRDIGHVEAEELADVGLTLARLFLMSLQNLYDTLTPENMVEAAHEIQYQQQQMQQEYVGSGGMMPPSSLSTSVASSRSAVVIEELTADDSFLVDHDILDHPTTTTKDKRVSTQGAQSHRRSTTTNDNQSTKRRRNKKKVRCLWPRLGPHVATIMDWTKEEATKRPILAVALGLTLWPMAVTTAVVGGTAVVVDGAVQDCYNHFQDGPLLSNIEQGAAQLYHTGRLSFVTTKLLTRQTLRVVSRQIDRQGGVGPIIENVRDAVVDRVVHPVETAGMVWDSIQLSIGFVQDTVSHVVAMRQEASTTAQELNQ